MNQINAIEDFFNKVTSLPKDVNGRILGIGSSGFRSVVGSGPIDAGNYTIRMPLPIALKQFAGGAYGYSEDNVPHGFCFPGFETIEDAADFYVAMFTDIATLTTVLHKGDGSVCRVSARQIKQTIAARTVTVHGTIQNGKNKFVINDNIIKNAYAACSIKLVNFKNAKILMDTVKLSAAIINSLEDLIWHVTNETNILNKG